MVGAGEIASLGRSQLSVGGQNRAGAKEGAVWILGTRGMVQARRRSD